MNRDILTEERIKRDIYKMRLYLARRYFLTVAFYLPVIVRFILLFYVLVRWLGILLLVIFAFAMAYEIYSLLRDIVCTKQGKYKIVTDKLIGIEQGTPRYLFNIWYMLFLYKSKKLIFPSYGSYFISPKYNYVTSENYSMNAKGGLNYAHIGDEYYLIISNEKRIMIAYNTSQFEITNK